MMEMDKKRVAIVCGVEGKLGRCIAEALTGAGVAVERIEPRQTSTESRRSHEIGLLVDLTSEDEIQAAIGAIVSRWRRVDYLINCPDLRLNGRLAEVPVETWDEILNVNLTSVFLSCKHVLPVMIEQGAGRIINLSSDAAHLGAFDGAAYAGAKAAVIGFSKALAREVAGNGIIVNVLSLGLMAEDAIPFRLAFGLDNIPLGRSGRWDEVAHAVLCLLDEKLTYTTGQTIHVNGGLLMR